MKEILKSLDFLGFPEYSISDQGNLYSHMKTLYHDKHIRGKVYDENTLRLITPVKRQREHHEKQVRLNKGQERIVLNLSFLVASAFVDNPNNYKDVDYLDDNNNNLNANNLFWTDKNPYVIPGYTFTTNDGSTCRIINRTDRKHVDVLLTSDNVVGNIKGVILNTTIRTVKNKTIKHPFVPSVLGYGCMGVGPYVSEFYIDGKVIKNTICTRWRVMIARCRDSEYSAYYGIPISEEFRNFQNYAHCVEELMKRCNVKNLDGFEIDKDFKANKLLGYSKETIVLVPHYLNSFLAKGSKGLGVLPLGVGYSPSRNEIRSTLTDSIGVTLKRYLYSDDTCINFHNVNTLIDLYIKEKSAKAKKFLERCYADYPDIVLDEAVIKVLNNFEKYIIDNYYFKNDWLVENVDGEYRLMEKMFDKVKNAIH